MIFTERTITIRNDSSSINAPVILYRGDKNVEVRFTLVESPYKYSNRDSINIIESTDASYAQLVIKTPNGRDPIFGDITAVGQSNVIFMIGYDMIDEIEEVGMYDFQIRLFDANQTSMATIPEVTGGFIIKEPIAKEDTTNNITNSAIVGSAVVTSDVSIPTFVGGSYNKTAWDNGTVISRQKLDKIEDGIYETYELSKVNNSQIKDKVNRGEGGVITNAMLSQEVKESMTGGSIGVVDVDTVLEENIVHGQITHNALGYGTLRLENVNLVNGVVANKILNWNNGIDIDNSNYTTSDYIKVKGNTDYYFLTNYIYVFYDSKKQFINGVKVDFTPEINVNKITTPENCKFIRLSCLSSNILGLQMYANLDDLNNRYNYIIPSVLDGKPVNLEDKYIKTNYLDDECVTSKKCSKDIVTFKKKKNLFNPEACTDGYFVNWNNGNAMKNDASDYTISDFIELEEGKSYVQNQTTHFALYDKYKVFTRGFKDSNNPEIITLIDNEKYIRVSFPLSTTRKYTYQLEQGTAPSNYVSYGYEVDNTIDGLKVYFPTNLKENCKNSRFYGKKVSWYGTSITQGGYGKWCENVNKVFNFTATNNGVGGTAICKENENSSMCTQNRMLGNYGNVEDPNTGEITTTGIAIPSDVEVIFIEGGANDWARNWPIGDKKISTQPNDQTFYGACDLMFRNLTTLFPNAEIIVVGAPFGKVPNRPGFTDTYGILNNENLQTIEYGDVLLEVAGKWGIKGINIGRLMQIHDNNVNELIPDGLHLAQTEAARRASDVIINYLLTLY